MPYEVSRFCPQMLAVALNLEHWDKISWKNRSPSGILSPKPVNCASHREIDEPKDRRGCSCGYLSSKGLFFFKKRAPLYSGIRFSPFLSFSLFYCKGTAPQHEKEKMIKVFFLARIAANS